jgi:hypothetical protein
MPEKYGRPLLIILALLVVGFVFLNKKQNCTYGSKYKNTLQHDINLEMVCK